MNDLMMDLHSYGRILAGREESQFKIMAFLVGEGIVLHTELSYPDTVKSDSSPIPGLHW